MKFVFGLLLLFSFPSIAATTVIQGKNKTYHTGLIHPENESATPKKYMELGDCSNLPDEFDLRTLGLVPPVRDQGNCGSCWSFSKTGSLESAMLAKGQTLDLSEQQLVSCDKSQYGCGGGFLSDFSYQIKNGQAVEDDFPYKAKDLRCKSGLKSVAKGASFQYIGARDRSPTVEELKCALVKSKTIPWITVSANNNWGSPPKSEKTVYSKCGHGQTNHAVGVVGYTTKDGKTAFIMKNSWGKNWGDKGYMSLPLGCDSFGDEVAFVVAE